MLRSRVVWRQQHWVAIGAAAMFTTAYCVGKAAGGTADFDAFMWLNGVLATCATHTNYLAARYGNPARRQIFGVMTAVCGLYAVTYGVGVAAVFDRADWSIAVSSYSWIAWLVLWQLHARWSIWAATLRGESPIRMSIEATCIAGVAATVAVIAEQTSLTGPVALLILSAVFSAHASYTNIRAAVTGQIWLRPHFGATAAIAAFYSAWYLIGATNVIARADWSYLASGFGWLVWLYVAQIHARDSLQLADQLRDVVAADPDHWVARLDQRTP